MSFHKIIKIIKFAFYLILFIVPRLAFCWDSTGHRLIAQIAYNHLTPNTKAQVDQLTKVLDPNYPDWSRFIYASTWADQLREDDVTVFNAWHFINLPYVKDGVQGLPPKSENVVWAIQQSTQVLASAKANSDEKAMFLKFLLHFVGDAHQPLHCIELYSQQFPNGDGSGNFYAIQDPNVTNLHALWDQGLGLFRAAGQSYPLSNKETLRLAKKIERDYPESSFGNQATDLNPQDWAQQSFQMGKDFAYNVPMNSRPTAEYVTKGQQIVEQQIALAGYRLANTLNRIF